MRRLLIFLAFSAGAFAQPLPPQSPIQFVSVDPSGACSTGASLRWNATSGNLWGCDAGTWTKLNGSGGGANPGGTTGQIQFNAGSSTFGGFTLSGDCTANTATGAITCTKINGSTPGGTCTNQVVTSISSSGVPTCGSVTNAMLSNPATTVNGATCTLGSTCNANYSTGSITSNHIAQFSGTGNQIQDGGALPTATVITRYMSTWQGGSNTPNSGANHVNGWGFTLDVSVSFGAIFAVSQTTDGGNLYSLAIINTSGTILCHPTTGTNIPTANTVWTNTCSEGTVTLSPGTYILIFTGAATTGKIYCNYATMLGPFYNGNMTGCTSASGVLSGTCAVSLASTAYSTNGIPNFYLQ